MCKKKINVPLYLLFAANCIYAVSHRAFNWLFYFAAILMAAVILFDIWGAATNGGK